MTAIAVARPAPLRTLWPAATAVGDQLAFPIVYMRGGTSRGAYLHARELPQDEALRDRVILALYGSPDARQIDGIGGAHPLTSKVAIVSPADDFDADVNYLFGQVRVDEAAVDYRGNCGNILAGVGPFAIDAGLVPACEPVTEVRIRNLNTGSVVQAAVPVVAGRARVCGTTAIAGVPHSGAGVRLDFSAAAGTLGHGLLPTSIAREYVPLAEDVRIPVSIVDAGNPTVFATARSLGLSAETMLADKLEPEVLDALESIRAWAARRLGLVQDAARAAEDSPAVPKVYIVNPPATCARGDGRWTDEADVSLLARGLVMGRPHPAFATTVAVCTAVASRIPGTVVHECAGPGPEDGVCRIGHPSGVLAVEVDVRGVHSDLVLRSAVLERTARRIMEGLAFVPVTVL
jgi:2-methylaconitate cis-trans-isomerase PrpF